MQNIYDGHNRTTNNILVTQTGLRDSQRDSQRDSHHAISTQ